MIYLANLYKKTEVENTWSSICKYNVLTSQIKGCFEVKFVSFQQS